MSTRSIDQRTTPISPASIQESTPRARQILHWLLPLESQKRHQGVRTDRLDGIENWVLEANEFINRAVRKMVASRVVLWWESGNGSQVGTLLIWTKEM